MVHCGSIFGLTMRQPKVVECNSAWAAVPSRNPSTYLVAAHRTHIERSPHLMARTVTVVIPGFCRLGWRAPADLLSLAVGVW
jgi:hypothetical protein